MQRPGPWCTLTRTRHVRPRYILFWYKYSRYFAKQNCRKLAIRCTFSANITTGSLDPIAFQLHNAVNFLKVRPQLKCRLAVYRPTCWTQTTNFIRSWLTLQACVTVHIRSPRSVPVRVREERSCVFSPESYVAALADQAKWQPWYLITPYRPIMGAVQGHNLAHNVTGQRHFKCVYICSPLAHCEYTEVLVVTPYF